MFFRRKTQKIEAGQGAVSVTVPRPLSDPQDTPRATKPFSVRARVSFADEFVVVQRDLEAARRATGDRHRITRGETLDAMLDALRAALDTGVLNASPVPLPATVWEGIRQIAIATGRSPATVIEDLIISELLRLGLAKGDEA